MKKTFIALCTVLLTTGAFSQGKNFIDQNYIEINGQAKLEVVPDEIYVAITLSEQTNKGKVSIDQQQKQMFKSLTDLGLDLEKNLVVEDQSADLKSYFLKKDAVLSTKNYQLKLTTATQVGEVFRALAKIDVSDVSIARTDLSNIEELRKQVRVMAVQSAKESAEVLAGAVDRKVGPALYIRDYGFSRTYPVGGYMRASAPMMDGALGGANVDPVLEFEKITIEHSVAIHFALE